MKKILWVLTSILVYIILEEEFTTHEVIVYERNEMEVPSIKPSKPAVSDARHSKQIKI